MTTAAFVRRIFLKDVRLLRWQILLLLGLGLATVLLTGDLNGAGHNALVPVLVMVFLVGGISVTVMVVLADPTGREFRFLLTRPVPGFAVGLAKALFLVVFLVLPYLLGLEFLVASVHLHLAPVDHLLMLIETLAWLGAGIAAVVLCCVAFRNGILVAAAIVILAFAVVLLISWWQHLILGWEVLPHAPTVEQQRLSGFRIFLAELLFVAVALPAIALRYRTRSLRAPLGTAAGGVALSLLAFLCPYNLDRVFFEQSAGAMSPGELARIRLALVPSGGDSRSCQINYGSTNGITYAYLNQKVRLDGIRPPYFVQTFGYHAVISLRSGRTIESDYSDSSGHVGAGGLSSAKIAFAAGFRSYEPPAEQDRLQGTLDLICYLPKNLPHEDIAGATVKGVVTLDVRRAGVAGSIPFRAGACFDGRRTRYQITSVESSDNEVHLNMDRFTAPLTLRGDLGSYYSPDDLLVLGVYRPFGEQLYQNSSGGNGGFNAGVHMLRMDISFGRGPWQATRYNPPGWRPLPSGWPSDSELVFVRSDPCGQVSLPYEIDNVDLTSDQPRHSHFPGSSPQDAPKIPSPSLLPAPSPN
jgi:hypothetical protein